MPAPLAAPPLERRLWQALAICAAIALGALALQIALRLPHRCELEWMEGAMVDHAERVRQGLGLYVPPTAQHVPFLYTPLLFWLGALLASVIGPGFLPLRLLSIAATAMCALMIARWTRRETGDRRAGFVAAGLFAAGYWYLQTWYDLARNDTLFVGPLLACAYLLRWRGRAGAAAAAIPALLAFLAKQTALMWLPALAVGALLLDWRKGLLFTAAAGALISATVLGMHLATDGWSTFYVFEMPQHHGIEGAYKLKYLTDDLVPLLPMTTLTLV